MAVPVLRLESASVGFGGLRAVDDVTMEIGTGERLGIIGPNGAGKTSLLNSLSGHYRLTRGTIWWGERQIQRLPPAAIAKLGIVRTFQAPLVMRTCSVFDNLALGYDLPWRRKNSTRGTRRSVRKSRIREVADELGLLPDLQRDAGELPHGGKRMVEIGRALLSEPKVLLLDEPTAGMARSEKDFVGEVVRRIQIGGDVPVVLIEHDVEFITKMCDRVVAMDRGTVIADGRAEDVLRHPAVVAGYLGTNVVSLPSRDEEPYQTKD